MSQRLAGLIALVLLAHTIAAQQAVPPPPPEAVSTQTVVPLPNGGVVTLRTTGDTNIEAAVERVMSAYQDGFGGVVGGASIPGGPYTAGFGGPVTMKTGTARLSGRVTNANGTPIRQATVRVNTTNTPGSRSVLTDNDGRYEFRDLPEGRFALSATKANHIMLNYGQRTPADAPRLLDLAEGQSLDRADLVLPRGGVIAGRLVDEFGEPLTDVSVMPMQRRMSQGQLRPMPTGRNAVTNDIGEFRLYGLPPGKYLIAARPRPAINQFEGAEIRSGYAASYYPGTANQAEAQAVTVGLGETINGVEFSVIPVSLAAVSGTAIDSHGAPVTRGSVSAMNRHVSGEMTMSAPIRQDGTFVIPGLPPGEYVLRATVPPVNPPSPATVAAGDAMRNVAVRTGPPEQLVATVAVSGADMAGVVLAPARKVAVTGRILFDGGSAGALRPSMIRLMLAPKSIEAGIMAVNQQPKVNDDFTFEWTAPAAEIAIRANAANQEWVLKSVRVRGTDITETGVDLREAQTLDGVEIEFTNRPPELTGTVTNAQGQPLSTYTVLVFPEDRARWILDSTVGLARPAAGGRYRLRTLPPGRYLAVAFEYLQPATYQDPDFLETLRNRATAFTLAEGQTTQVDLRTAPDGGR